MTSWIPRLPAGRQAFAGMTLLFSVSTAFAASVPLREWSGLSDRDISPQGKAALGSGSAPWKHAESEHFVYHFTDAKEAGTVYTHAELYYGWIKELFGVQKDEWRKKAHVFVFEDKAVWEAFNARNGAVLEGSAFTNGWELFIYRDPFWLSPKKTLAHELTHLILFRFLDGPVPLFLNEGFAEFVAYRAIATQFDGNEYAVRTVQLVPKERFIPLEELAKMTSYPKDTKEALGTFYRESELLTRYLILNHKGPKFYELLRKVSGGGDFEGVLEGVYGFDLERLSSEFVSFAVLKG